MKQRIALILSAFCLLAAACQAKATLNQATPEALTLPFQPSAVPSDTPAPPTPASLPYPAAAETPALAMSLMPYPAPTDVPHLPTPVPTIPTVVETPSQPSPEAAILTPTLQSTPSASTSAPAKVVLLSQISRRYSSGQNETVTFDSLVVTYDPSQWVFTPQDPFLGIATLSNLGIKGCYLAQHLGSGLPPSLTMESDRTIVTNDVRRVFVIREIASKKIYRIVYEVPIPMLALDMQWTPADQEEKCIQAGEAVLKTLELVIKTPEP